MVSRIGAFDPFGPRSMEDLAPAAQAASLWGGLNLLLLMVLSALVVRQRQAHRVAIGDGGVESVQRASRAFGNAAEYIPAGMAVLALMTLVGAPEPSLHLAGATLFAGRLIHAVGLSRSTGPSLPRVAGMVITYLFMLCAAVTLIFYAV
jgi:uncharacterized membrane protein YecN with MAPEG domain